MFYSAVSDMDPTCLPGHARLSGMNLHGGLMHSGNGMMPPYQTLGGGLVMPDRGGVMAPGMMTGGRVVGANPTIHLGSNASANPTIHLGNASTRDRGARNYLRKQNTVQCTRYMQLSEKAKQGPVNIYKSIKV